MATMASKEDLIHYFTEKSQRATREGGIYLETLNELLQLFQTTETLAEIKSVVRQRHREKVKEIQRTESVETRIEQRKQLGAYDDCLTQIRAIPAQ